MSHTAFRHFFVHAEDGIGWLEYHRPPVNAFDWEMLREAPAALHALASDPAVRVIVVASALEKYFNSGADLKVLAEVRGGAMREWVGICHDQIVRELRICTKPLLAAIHGVAVGGGLEIAWHCDVRFAADDARIGQPEINIAFIPPIGATQALARLVGRHRALRFLYDGELLPARRALELGLVDEVVPRARLRDEVMRYARRLAGKPGNALAAIRRCITEGGGVGFDEGLAIELEEAVRLSESQNFAEGVAAFLAKRAPRWV
ncbi:MAG TPA: enoyl-CoA hydratase/isomerase family protein [Burkholderiales bacterium]|nr:enoyl-CoA hydratase/isomerase family protein [Burkholderiales bacterium]